jgi:hypothetical protein
VSVAPFASRVVAVSCTVFPAVRLAVGGLTATDATATGGGGGGAVTVTAAEPWIPSLVAVMVALPAATPVTTPFADTVAAPVFEELQLTVRPVSVAPLASRVVAESCTVLPATTVAVVGATATLATGAGAGSVTVTSAVPLVSPAVAVIVASPVAMAVTTPSETRAMLTFDEDQTTDCPDIADPAASRTTAENVTAPPRVTFALLGLITRLVGTPLGSATSFPFGRQDSVAAPSAIAAMVSMCLRICRSSNLVDGSAARLAWRTSRFAVAS